MAQSTFGTCRDVINKYRDVYHIEYKKYLTNHLMHCVFALAKLGMSAERIEEAAARYVTKLDDPKLFPLDARQYPIVTFDGVLAFRGVRRQFYDLLDYFNTEIGYDGPEAVIKKHLPHLLEGTPGAAFHGLIHLGYSLALHRELVKAGEEDTAIISVAEGLAYLTHSSLKYSGMYTLPGEEAETEAPAVEIVEVENPFLELAAAVKVAVVAGTNMMGGLGLELTANPEYEAYDVGPFQRGMMAFNRSISLNAALDNAVKDAYNVMVSIARKSGSTALCEAFVYAMARLHLATGASDFFILHTVSASWSLLQPAYLLEPDHAAYGCLVLLRGAVAAYVVQDCPKIAEEEFASDYEYDGPGSELSDEEFWAKVSKDSAANNQDEHVYKGTHILLELAQMANAEEHKHVYRNLANRITGHDFFVN